MLRSLIRPFFNFLPSPLVANNKQLLLQATRSLVAISESSPAPARLNTSLLIHNSLARNTQIYFNNNDNNQNINQHKANSPTTTVNPTNQIAKNQQDKASPEQLTHIQKHLEATLPNFIKIGHQLSIYTPDTTFIDNIRGVKTKGLVQYSIQLNLIRIYHIIRYSHIKIDLLNLVKIPEESCIRIRWRATTKPGLLTFLLLFWKFGSMEKWKDGISTFYVNNQGKVFCHVCDNIDVDMDIKDKEKQSIKSRLVNRGLNV